MKKLTLMLVLGVSSAVYANQNLSDEDYLGLTSAGASASAASLSIIYDLEYKKTKNQEARARVAKEKTFILKPQRDSKGHILTDSMPYKTGKAIDKTLTLANSYDHVSVSYIELPDKAYLKFLKGLEDGIKEADDQIAKLKSELADFEKDFPHGLERQEQLRNLIISKETKKNLIREQINIVQNLSPEEFVKKYEHSILVTREFEVRSQAAFNDLNRLLEDSSNKKKVVISVSGRMNASHYADQAQTSKTLRKIFTTSGSGFALGSVIMFGKSYLNVADGESAKDSFENSSEIQPRSSKANKR